MPVHYVPVSSGTSSAKDAIFTREFTTPLGRHPPRLTYPGYKRAIELYGCEDNLLRNLKTTSARFERWKDANSDRLFCFRNRVVEDRLDWQAGYVNPTTGEYYARTTYAHSPSPVRRPLRKSESVGHPGLRSALKTPTTAARKLSARSRSCAPRSFSSSDSTPPLSVRKRDDDCRFTPAGFTPMSFTPATPGPPLSASLSRRRASVHVPTTPGASSSIERTLPHALRGLAGNFRYIVGQDVDNQLGVAQIAEVAMEMLAAVARARSRSQPLSPQSWDEIQELVDYIGFQGIRPFRVAAERSLDQPNFGRSLTRRSMVPEDRMRSSPRDLFDTR